MLSKQQEACIKLFEEVRDRCEKQVLPMGMMCYTFEEDSWRYQFMTCNDRLKKVEAFNHRELIEVYF
ncbi:MAG: hypothetical protein J6T10_00840 [Methanobrevibacter sp.]|nr:hypothetical protein [Methanobrevibacter sp.]